MVYIQSDDNRKMPHHFDAACGMYGALDRGLKCRLTTFDEVQSGKFDLLIEKNVFIGSVEFMKEVFKRVGLENVKLPKNSNRPHRVDTIGNIRESVKLGNKYFIKPLDIKLFTGFVIDSLSKTCHHDIPDDTQVMVYDVIEYRIVSEWRIYIHRNRMVDSKNYCGDFTISPNYDYVKQIIEENKQSFPSAYTIDVGILTNDENVVIEFNDMWAIGNYGMPNDEYYQLLRSRYFEIMSNIKKK